MTLENDINSTATARGQKDFSSELKQMDPGIITAERQTSAQNDYSELVTAAKEQLHNAKAWNKSQLLKLARFFLGPFARVRGSDDTNVYVYLEKEGTQTRLGTGKAKEGKGAFLDAFMNTFIRPLEAKLKMEEESRRQAQFTREKAEVLVQEKRAEHEATLSSTDATDEAKNEARQALENLEENLKRISAGQLKLETEE
jgi:hypothetical protein